MCTIYDHGKFSMGILTYAFIYSYSSNTYPIILLLEACISKISRYTHLTLAVAVFIFHGICTLYKLFVNTCSLELLLM